MSESLYIGHNDFEKLKRKEPFELGAFRMPALVEFIFPEMFAKTVKNLLGQNFG